MYKCLSSIPISIVKETKESAIVPSLYSIVLDCSYTFTCCICHKWGVDFRDSLPSTSVSFGHLILLDSVFYVIPNESMHDDCREIFNLAPPIVDDDAYKTKEQL